MSVRTEKPDDFFDRLYEENMELKKNLRNLEVERKKEEVKGCTFRPKINRASRSISRSGRAHDRLHREQETRKREQAKAKAEHEKEVSESLSFRPLRKTKDRDSDFGLNSRGETFD